MSPGFLVAVGAVIVIGLGALIFFMLNDESRDAEAAAALEEALQNLPTELADGQSLGSPDAPLTITLFEDFQCPFCLRYTAEDEPMIVDEYVKTGKVRLEFKHLPILGPESVRAALAATCAADQNKFWEFHHRVFKKEADEGQLSNERLNRGHLSDENLRQIAQETGLDMAAYDSCLNDPATQEKVTNQNREATELGINSTPTFLFNGRPLGGTPIDLDAWREIIDQQIAAAEASPEATETAEADDEGEPTATPTEE